jgi:hypothetical protein
MEITQEISDMSELNHDNSTQIPTALDGLEDGSGIIHQHS